MFRRLSLFALAAVSLAAASIPLHKPHRSCRHPKKSHPHRPTETLAPLPSIPGSSPEPQVEPSALGRIHAAADHLLGLPYRFHGSGPRGFDCSGLVLQVFHALGAFLSGRTSQDYWKQGEPVTRDHLQPGDLVFFSNRGHAIGHVGIYLSSGNFLHASPTRGVTVSALDGTWFQHHYQGARRIPSFGQAVAGSELQTLLEVPSEG